MDGRLPSILRGTPRNGMHGTFLQAAYAFHGLVPAARDEEVRDLHGEEAAEDLRALGVRPGSGRGVGEVSKPEEWCDYCLDLQLLWNMNPSPGGPGMVICKWCKDWDWR